MKLFLKICNYLIWGLWRLLRVIIGAIVFFGAWFWPMYYYLGEDNAFAAMWVLTYGIIVFYGLALWHVVSEDERDVSVWIKMRQGILISFNKMLFAFLVFTIYIMLMAAASEGV